MRSRLLLSRLNMTLSNYEYMQKAVDIVNRSEHPRNKIAAILAGEDVDGTHFFLAHTNYWPEEIRKKLGAEARIGNASGTVHAETACILKSPRTQDACVYVTDPVCPNCAKNLAEAGIRALYIDHKGFEKDFLARRRAFFETMSTTILKQAGISVYKIFRKDEKLIPLLQAKTPPARPRRQRQGLEILEAHGAFRDFIAGQAALMQGKSFAVGFGHDRRHDRTVALRTAAALPPGMTEDTAGEVESGPEPKYSYVTEPVNRLLMSAARLGVRLDHEHIYTSRVPTAREMVNLAGAEISRLHIGDTDTARDREALEAMRVLENSGVLTFSRL